MPRCISCRHDNPAEARFCLACGSALSAPAPLATAAPAAVCIACGEKNPEGARFCLACGAPFTPPEPLREERKLITVLFTDIVGSTARAEQLDPEDVRAMLRPYYSRLRSELERFGGTVEKFIGDAVVALFGAPVAHEDDPERAVRAALAIRQAIDELNAGDEWLDLKIRIGVNTGEALVVVGARASEGEGVAAGDVMNTAARLQSSAPVDGILVGELTYRATSDAIDYRQAEPIAAKGKSEPVPVWQALGAKEKLARRPVPQTPLVGRREELDAIWSAWRSASERSRPALATVLGSPGVGKTRLVCEFTEAVAEVADVHWGRCLSYGEGITYWPINEALKSAAGILQSDDGDTMSEKLGGLLEALPTDNEDELRTMAAALANLVGVATTPRGTYSASQIGQGELHWGIRRVLELLASERPIVLVLEDLHWAEPTLLELIHFLVSGSAALLVLGSARPELAEKQPSFLAGGETIALDPLTGEESVAFLSGLLGDLGLRRETVETVLRNAGGNPLFLEETVRMLASGQAAGGDGDALPVPTNLQTLIGSRLDQLVSTEKQLVQLAAVIGSVFWSGAVAHLEHSSDDTLGARLAALEQRDLIRAHELSTVAAQHEYAFKHILIRDVAYGELPKGRRAGLHLDFAGWLATLPGSGDELIEIVAHHLEQSCRLAREVASSPVDPPVAMAVEALTRAADKAERREGFREAERFYARALELLDDDSSEPVLELRLGRGRMLVALGDLGRAQETLGLVTEGARDRGRRDLCGRALVELGNIAWKQGRAADGRESLREAESIAAEIGERALEVRAAYESAYLRAWLDGESESALEDLLSALAIADELDDRALRIGGHMRLGSMLFNAGRLSEAESHLRSCVELAAELGSRRDAARATCMLGILNGYRGDNDDAERLALEAHDWLERTGDSRMQVQNLRTLARSALSRRDLAAAEERLREALPLALEGGGYLVVEVYRYLAEVLVRQARVDEANELVAFAARDVSEEDGYARAALLVAEAAVATAAGEASAATSAFTRALQLLEEQQLLVDLAETRLAFARSLRSLGEETGARAELEQARATYKRIGAETLLAVIDEELEELAGAGGAGPRASS